LGKLGAAIGAYSFFYIAQESSYGVVMGITCAISLLGAVISQIYIDKDKIDRYVNIAVAITGGVNHSLFDLN